MYRSVRGFTIVELLIVIVVIAILAAITSVAYNGIQDRANNTTTLSGVETYTKLFQMYASDNGTYPSTASYPCLGSNWQGNCARIVQGSSGCAYTGTASGSAAAAFNSQLSSYAATMPAISNQTMSCNGDTYTGAYASANSTNTKNLNIVVFLKGSLTCPQTVGSATYYYNKQADQTTLCSYNMPALP